MSQKKLILALEFLPKENASGIFIKNYAGYKIEVDFEKNQFNFGGKIKFGDTDKSIQNITKPEDWVVLECVDRLLTKGYKPEDITLEKIFPSGHGHSGRLDIFIEKDGKAFLMIECKTFGKEYEKEQKNIYKNGGQLFTYFQNDRAASVLVLYASQLNKKGEITYENSIINIEEEYRETTNVKDFFDRWNKLPKTNGIFDAWVLPYGFQSKALTPNDLKDIEPEDSSFIFNQFLEILRHNVVSDKPNAFNKIFTLFLCKIYDEKNTRPNVELSFQWFYGPHEYDGEIKPADNHISFQKRLTDLYGKGMREFLEKEVTDISDAEFELKYGDLNPLVKAQLLDTLTEIRLKKNNEFAIKEVFNDDSFEENAKVVKEVVELLQGFKIRYTKKQQYLSDFFELLLTTGLKQESGQFFTPVPIAQFIIKSLPLDTLVNEKLLKGDSKNLLPTIIDYASGSGHFITESMHEVQRILDKTDATTFIESTAKKIRNWQDDHFDWAYKYIYGIEKDYRLVKVGKVGCYLHGDGLAQIIHSDGLGNFSKTEEYKGLLKKTDKDFPQENKQFDIVVSNPPYSVSSFRNNARKYYTGDDFRIYNKLTDNSSEIECLFIERTLQLLKDGGIAGIILPSSILSNTGIYTKARELIIEYFDIVAIAELGSNTFMATGTNTVILFLKRRNNYDVLNLKASVEKVIINKRDVTLNGIEKPLAKYVAHVWEKCSLEDYLTLLEQDPNTSIQEHEIYKEYRKKLKAKSEANFWQQVITIETEKLRYFVITQPQQTVLIKSGSKNAEKRFLGYEFSNRRGSEGIHAIQRSKEIEECTQLFDATVFDNPEKASTYIYKAFQGDTDFPIAETLKKNITRHSLVDMFTFDRVDFEKTISLSVKKKVKYQEIWDTDKLIALSEIAAIKKGSSITKSKTTKGIIPVIAGGKEPAYFHNEKNREGNVITVSASGANAGFVNYFENPIFASDCNTIISKNELAISTKLIYLFLFTIQNNIYQLQRGQAQPHVYGDDLSKVKIPLPPKAVQEKIVKEIEVLEEKENSLSSEISNLKEKFNILINESSAGSTKLSDVAIVKGGKRIPKGSSFTYEKTLYPYLRVSDFKNGSININSLKYIDKTIFDKIKNYTISKDDVYISIAGTIGLVGIIPNILDGKSLTENAAKISIQNKDVLNQKYLYYCLVSENLQKQIEYNTKAVGVPKLALKRIETLRIPLPTLSKQQKIVTQIEKIEEKITALENELAAIPAKKEAVLKKYL